MNPDMSDTFESLADVTRVLQTPVPIAPGLPERVAGRRRRQQRRRAALFGGGTVAAAMALAVVATRAPEGGGGTTFALDAPAVTSVSLVGDFTNWRTDSVHLARRDDGRWQVTLKLPPGRYRFAYVVDGGEWRADAAAATVPDDFGRPTSILTVPTSQ